MPLTIPIWRSFQSLASSAEAASVSVCCNYSLGTLEVSCRKPGVANFALTEQKHADSWRWAIFNTDGSILSTGCEPTRAQAHLTAEEALELSRTKIPF
jgi:hypothetical protein